MTAVATVTPSQEVLSFAPLDALKPNALEYDVALIVEGLQAWYCMSATS